MLFVFQNKIWFKVSMKYSDLKILVVEDDAFTAQNNKRKLSKYGKVSIARDTEEAHALINSKKFDIGFFDLNLFGELDGLKLLKLSKMIGLYSIVLSGETRQDIFEEALENGAKDYLSKPFTDEKLDAVLKRFDIYLKHTEFENLINDNFITKNQSLTNELYKIKNLGASTRPVYIGGETGTGKRVVAHLIKKILDCNNFVEINCSQYNDELFASEVFGHVKGSFSGAVRDKKGLLEIADGGVIFLDEIHALSLRSQKTLLKAIEEKEFYPVGADKKIKSNFRVISASCEDIFSLISQGLFRQDLYARISTFNINLTPLRERKEDINLLLSYFIDKQPFRIVIKEEAKSILESYDWPQNTREIQDLVENWAVNGHRLISADILPPHIRSNINPQNSIISELYLDLIEEMGLKEFLTVFKKELITAMIKRHNGVPLRASKAMGGSYPSLLDFLKKHSHKTFRVGRS